MNRKSLQGWIILGLLALMPCWVSGQQVTHFEYFFDSIPSVGQGTIIPVSTANDSIDGTFSIDLNNIDPGRHLLLLCAVDSSGIRGHFAKYWLFVEQATQPASVTTLEWFVDNEPGLGQGNIQAISPVDTFSGTPLLATDTLPGNPYRLYVRVRNDLGLWSHYSKYRLFVDPAGNSIPLTSLEYFIDQDPGVGQGMNIAIPGLDSVDRDYMLQTDTLPIGQYLLTMRAKNAEGRWSHNVQQAFDVCTMYGPKASFIATVNRNQVFFSNTSEYQMEARWDFGDGATDNLSFNPVHTYVPGIYQAQLIASNICGEDTLIQGVSVRGVAEMIPTVHANEGVLLADVYGAELDSVSNIRLIGNGVPAIDATSYTYIDGTHLRPVFKFRGNAVGTYHLEITGSGGRSDTLFDALTLEQSVGPNLWLDVAGPTELLINRKVKRTIYIGNKGNVGAYGVPLYIKAPKSSELTNISGKHQDSLPQAVYDSMPHFSEYIDTFNNDTTIFGAFYIPWIRPGEVKSYTFSYRPTELGDAEIIYYLSDPMLDEALLDSTFRSSCTGLPSCAQCALDILGLLPGLGGCAVGLFDVGCAIGEAASGGAGGDPINLATSIAGAFLGCSPGLGLAYELGNLAAGAASALSGASSSCGPGGCNPRPKKPDPIRVVGSFDPNIKVGPVGYSSENYIIGTDPMVYSIYFENADTATAPANEVLILDTLDKQAFDLSTLQFLQFGFGDTLVSVLDQSGSRFVADVDLRPDRNTVVRVLGQLDTASGVLSVYYASLEPDTLKLVDNPFDGFLPPNVNAPEGEGFVQFVVAPKPSLQHLDRIENDAAIYFDANNPIYTPVWLNTVDQEAPVSEVDDLPAQTAASQFTVSWQGTDDHAGIMDYDVYVIVNDTFSYVWKKGVSYTSATFNGAIDQNYKFYSIAYDNVGNVEEPPFDPVVTPDAETTVVPTGLSAKESVAIAVYPNPAKQTLFVEATLPQAKQVRLSLKNAVGITLSRWTYSQVSGKQQWQLPLESYASGLYYVVVQWGEQAQTYPVAIQR